MRFVIVDSKDRFRDAADDLREAVKKVDKLAKAEPGVKFFTYQQIREFCVPTDEQKEDKEFWR